MNQGPGTTGNADGLVVLRRLWASLTAAGVLVAFVVSLLDGKWGGSSGVAVGMSVGLLSIASAMFCRRKKLDVSSEGALGESYRKLFFLSFALVEYPYLIAFVLSFIMDQRIIVPAALPFFLLGMFMIAPLSGEMGRRQQQITAQGSALSLEDALRNMPTRVAR